MKITHYKIIKEKCMSCGNILDIKKFIAYVPELDDEEWLCKCRECNKEFVLCIKSYSVIESTKEVE